MRDTVQIELKVLTFSGELLHRASVKLREGESRHIKDPESGNEFEISQVEIHPDGSVSARVKATIYDRAYPEFLSRGYNFGVFKVSTSGRCKPGETITIASCSPPKDGEGREITPGVRITMTNLGGCFDRNSPSEGGI